MGHTNPNYPVMEIALSCEHGGTHSGGLKERKAVGDIIAIRKPGSAIGSAEMSRYLWLRIEGLEENQMYRLTDPVYSNPADDSSAVFDKRRYCIPLDRLKAITPSLDIARATNLNDKYQPFLGVDEEPPFRFISDVRPVNVHGLIFDKVTGRFI